MNKREYVMKEIFKEDFIKYFDKNVVLKEEEESGKSLLNIEMTTMNNLYVENVDKKNTQLLFFQEGKIKALFKRVDHIIFEAQNNNKWKVHLIEMKSSVGAEKWIEVKGKFRASYLLVQALSSMLEMKIDEVIMYTTYEKVNLIPSETMPTQRRVRSGQILVHPEKEWDGTNFCLNFGEYISFKHVPIQMNRDKKNILQGSYTIN